MFIIYIGGVLQPEQQKHHLTAQPHRPVRSAQAFGKIRVSKLSDSGNLTPLYIPVPTIPPLLLINKSHYLTWDHLSRLQKDIRTYNPRRQTVKHMRDHCRSKVSPMYYCNAKHISEFNSDEGPDSNRAPQ